MNEDIDRLRKGEMAKPPRHLRFAPAQNPWTFSFLAAETFKRAPTSQNRRMDPEITRRYRPVRFGGHG
jgi:hypothetical protein